jgi:hypothetical protein
MGAATRFSVATEPGRLLEFMGSSRAALIAMEGAATRITGYRRMTALLRHVA